MAQGILRCDVCVELSQLRQVGRMVAVEGLVRFTWSDWLGFLTGGSDADQPKCSKCLRHSSVAEVGPIARPVSSAELPQFACMRARWQRCACGGSVVDGLVGGERRLLEYRSAIRSARGDRSHQRSDLLDNR